MNEEIEPINAQYNHVWQFTRTHTSSSGKTVSTKYYTETTYPHKDGFKAKNTFIQTTLKHPHRNLYSYHKLETGDVLFRLVEMPVQVWRREWMDKTEEDAKCELLDRALDPASEYDERLLQSILSMTL